MKINTDWDINYNKHDHVIVDLDEDGNLFSHYILICWLIENAVCNPESKLYEVIAFPTKDQLGSAVSSIRVSIGRNKHSEERSNHQRKESEARILVRITQKDESFVQAFIYIRILLNELLNLLHNHPNINSNYTLEDSIWQYDSDVQLAWADFEFGFKEYYTWKNIKVDKKAKLNVDMRVD